MWIKTTERELVNADKYERIFVTSNRYSELAEVNGWDGKVVDGDCMDTDNLGRYATMDIAERELNNIFLAMRKGETVYSMRRPRE